MSKPLFIVLLFSAFLVFASGCTASYSFTGASIPPEAKTISIKQFRNNSSMVVATLSQTLTDALRNRFQTQTNLDIIENDGDLRLEGAITKYVPARPSAISGNETAALNRMTITLKVKYVNTIDPTKNFEKTFTDFVEYDSSLDLASAESGLISEVAEKLIDQIFNESVVNW